MVAPTTSYPCSTSRAAATELSTPPDIATSTFSRTAEHSRELAHLLDDCGEYVGGAIDVGLAGGVAEAEAQRAEGQLSGHAECREDVRGLDGASRARRAPRDRYARQIEVHEQGLAVGTRHADAEDVGSAGPIFRRHDQVGHPRPKPLEEPGAEALESRGLGFLFSRGQLRRPSERDSAGHVLGARPDPELLSAAMNDRLDRLPVAHDKGAEIGRAHV